MVEPQYSALWAAVMGWASSFGEGDISQRPGLWHRKTKKVGALGPIDVRINPHKEEVDGIPQFGATLSMDDYFPGLIALVGPNFGFIMHSRVDGEDEAGLIAHFKAQAAEKANG
jgi:hypothetical protein